MFPRKIEKMLVFQIVLNTRFTTVYVWHAKYMSKYAAVFAAADKVLKRFAIVCIVRSYIQHEKLRSSLILNISPSFCSPDSIFFRFPSLKFSNLGSSIYEDFSFGWFLLSNSKDVYKVREAHKTVSESRQQPLKIKFLILKMPLIYLRQHYPWHKNEK